VLGSLTFRGEAEMKHVNGIIQAMLEVRDTYRDVEQGFGADSDRLSLFLAWAELTQEYRVSDAFNRFRIFVHGEPDE
jgi:hypothetical protein